MVGSLCRYCGGGLFAAVAQPAEEQQFQSEFLQGRLLHPENEAVVWGWRWQLGLVRTKGHQPSPHAAGKQNACICRPLRLNFKFIQHNGGCCSTELSAVFSAGASHGVSSEFPRSYSQLSEIHVSVWPAATALHHPHGHWSACWHPYWGKLLCRSTRSCQTWPHHWFQTINTVSEVIRGSQVNQDYFASVNAPSNPPR